MRKSNSRKTILKEASVLLIAAILILTALFVLTPITKVTKAAPVFPPIGWGIQNNNGGSTWVLSTTGQRSGSYCAKCINDYPLQPNDDLLFTKPIFYDGTGYFDFYVKGYSDDTYNVYYWPGIGAEWIMIDSGVGGPSYFHEGPYYPSDYGITSGQTVYFAIRYTGNNAWYLLIDDVTFPDGTTEGFEDATNQLPNLPSNPSPANGASVDPCSPPTCLGWDGGDPDIGDTVKYDIYFAANTPNPYPSAWVAQIPYTGLTSLTWCPPGGFSILSGITYYWKIVATDSHGAIREGDVWSFTTPTSVLQITQVAADGNKVKVEVKNTGPADIYGISLEITLTIDPTRAPCDCGCTPFLKIGTTNYYTVYTETSPVDLTASGTIVKKINIKGGCACFEVKVTVNACSGGSSGKLQVIKHGCFCELNIW